MDKIAEIGFYIAHYGYFAIFLLVFLQELGVPNPITNELVLMYSGYLAYKGMMSLTKIILVTVSADFIGTSILYFVFYAFGKYLLNHKPKWIPIPMERIEIMKQRVFKGGRWTVFVGRLMPFLRGYVSIGAGIVQMSPVPFLTTVITSAITWSGGLVMLGWLLSPYWNQVTQKMGVVENVIFFAIIAIIIILLSRYLARNFFQKRKLRTANE